MVAERTFREDLYYRLRVVEILLPSLRERAEDIPLLVMHMIHKAAAALGTPALVLSDSARTALSEYAWPGNVRELENCVMRAVVLAASSVVRPEHLAMGSPSRREAVDETAVRPLHELEREQVSRALAFTRGHKAQAAEMLGVSRPRLNRLIDKYGLS